jgi:hypothetical protein
LLDEKGLALPGLFRARSLRQLDIENKNAASAGGVFFALHMFLFC